MTQAQTNFLGMIIAAGPKLILKGISLPFEGLASLIHAGKAQFGNFITNTPPENSYDNPDLKNQWDKWWGWGIAIWGLLCTIVGLWILAGDYVGIPTREPKEIIVNLFAFGLLAAFSLKLVAAAIQGSNAFCKALSVGGADRFLIDTPPKPDGDIGLFFGQCVLIAVSFIFMIVMWLRMWVLDALTIVAPVCLLTGMLPATSRLFDAWTSRFTQFLLMQPFVVVALLLATSASDMLHTSQGVADALGLLSTIAALVLALFAPGIMGNVISSAQSRAVQIIKIPATRLRTRIRNRGRDTEIETTTGPTFAGAAA
jgi:hypothetical protein